MIRLLTTVFLVTLTAEVANGGYSKHIGGPHHNAGAQKSVFLGHLGAGRRNKPVVTKTISDVGHSIHVDNGVHKASATSHLDGRVSAKVTSSGVHNIVPGYNTSPIGRLGSSFVGSGNSFASAAGQVTAVAQARSSVLPIKGGGPVYPGQIPVNFNTLPNTNVQLNNAVSFVNENDIFNEEARLLSGNLNNGISHFPRNSAANNAAASLAKSTVLTSGSSVYPVPGVNNGPAVHSVPGRNIVAPVYPVPGVNNGPAVHSVPGRNIVAPVYPVPGINNGPAVHSVPGRNIVAPVYPVPGAKNVAPVYPFPESNNGASAFAVQGSNNGAPVYPVPGTNDGTSAFAVEGGNNGALVFPVPETNNGASAFGGLGGNNGASVYPVPRVADSNVYPNVARRSGKRY